MKSVRWMVSYILVAVVGLGLAFALSVRFMAPAHSQDNPPPASGDLPPEFMKEVESTQAPPAGTPAASGAAGNQVPPPPPEGQVPPPTPVQTGEMNSGPVQSTEPQPQILGDGMTAQTIAPPRGDDYYYDPTGKRDPFRQYRPSVLGNPQKQQVALEPLQRFDLERLQIIGILWEVRTPRAMVKDPDGAIHTIVKNSRMGRNEGYVAAIREGEIVVIETTYDDGKPIKSPRVLEFKK